MRNTLLLIFTLFSIDSAFSQATAILDIDTAFAKKFDVQEYFNVDITSEQRAQYKNEIEKLTQYLKVHPNEYTAYINRGAYFSFLGFHVNAIKDYDAALAIQNNIPEAIYNRGLAKARYFYTVDSCKDIYTASQLGLTQATTTFDKACKRYTTLIVKN